MNNENIIKHIITPALQAINSYTDDRLDMVFFTGGVETLYQHIRQINGPALGLFQQEPADQDDIWRNLLGQSSKNHLVNGLVYLSKRPGIYQELEVNPFYAAAMCAIHYMRYPEPLPKAGNRTAQAEYWKCFYNTVAGKGTPGEALERMTVVTSGAT